jgi:hypothetical protein
VCGALAAAVWALEQPLDKRVFRSAFDDIELLGRAFTSGEGWYPAGLALHLQNGALFGAIYANLAPAMPVAPALRGPSSALLEHLATWPLVTLGARVHPAGERSRALVGNRRAFWQSLWRHVLFGFVLGELERRLSAASEPASPSTLDDYSSNGHGRLERTVNVTTYGPAD